MICQWSEEASKGSCSVPEHVSDSLKNQKDLVNWSHHVKDLCAVS